MSVLEFSSPPLPHFVAIGEDCYEPGDKHPHRRNIGVFDLLVVTQGSLFMGEESESWVVGAGQALVLRPDQSHFASDPCYARTHFYWLHFQTLGSWSEIDEDEKNAQSHIPTHLQSSIESDASNRPIAINPPDADDVLTPYGSLSAFLTKVFPIRIARLSNLANSARTFEHLIAILDLQRYPQPSARWQQQLLFQEVMQDLNAGHSQSRQSGALQVAEQVASFLRHHYKSEINYDVLRENFNFHPTYVARCMRSVFDCSPLEYLIRYRIEQAKLLLMNSDITVQNVAEEVGFNHFSYFCRAFKKFEGTTPRTFRKRYQV